MGERESVCVVGYVCVCVCVCSAVTNKYTFNSLVVHPVGV